MAHEITERIHRFHEDYDILSEDRVFAPETYDGYLHKHAAVRSGGSFHAVKCRNDTSFHDQKKGWRIVEIYHGDIYSPPHPSMTYEDVEGASYAYDDGTYWLFAHCSPGEQIDFAVSARTFAINQFQASIDKAQVKVDQATNAPAKALAVAKVKALVDFSVAVGGVVHDTVVGATLGHYHRDPHHDHRRDLTVDAIASVLADWKKKALTDTAVAAARKNVTTDAASVSTTLNETNPIEWRHVRAARLEAEKKKKEAAAETPTETPTESSSDSSGNGD